MGFGQFAFPSWRARALQRVPHQIRGSLVQLGGLFGDGEVPAPPVAAVILDALDNHHPNLHFTGARTAREHLMEARLDVPSWEALANGLRPDDENSVSEPQCKAMRPVNERFLEGVVQPRLLDASRALLRSQSGPFASLPFTSFPSAPHARFDPQPFRVLLLRRLWLPLPLSSRSCRCGRPLDSSGHHRAACAVAGVLVQGVSHWSLPQRGFAGKQAAETVFGQSVFGHRVLGPVVFGQIRFGPIRFWPIHFWPKLMF